MASLIPLFAPSRASIPKIFFISQQSAHKPFQRSLIIEIPFHFHKNLVLPCRVYGHGLHFLVGARCPPEADAPTRNVRGLCPSWSAPAGNSYGGEKKKKTFFFLGKEK